MTHDFDDSLAYSHRQSDSPWWEDVYRRAFPDFASMMDLRHDGWHQRAGRDRVVMLTSGRAIYIDEKVRRQDYGDIALEVWSTYPKGGRPPFGARAGAAPGWARAPKDCDWLAYAIEPIRSCHLFPFLGVRAALAAAGPKWSAAASVGAKGFRWCVARNNRYDTISIAVPIDALRTAINESMTITWTEDDGGWPPVAPVGGVT